VCVGFVCVGFCLGGWFVGGCIVFIRVWSTELCFVLCLCLSLFVFCFFFQTHDDDFNKADRFYRKALGCPAGQDEEKGISWVSGDSDERVLKNYEDFKKNRLPGGRYEGGGPSQEVVKRAVSREKQTTHGCPVVVVFSGSSSFFCFFCFCFVFPVGSKGWC
jgi:hypothetical protein